MSFITIVDTGIISYVSTRNLAERWGFGALSWLYPLCLDAVAAVGMDLWMSNSPAKRPAACLSLFAVGLSLAANIADWLYVGPGAAALGAVPPLMLAALLLTMHYHAARAEQTAQTPSSGSSAVLAGPAGGAPMSNDHPRRHGVDAAGKANHDRVPHQDPNSGRRQKGPKPRVSDHEVIAAIRRRNGSVSRRGLMTEFGMGTPRATRLLAEANNGTHVDLTGISEGNP